jgi:thiol:disulfide interchange protein
MVLAVVTWIILLFRPRFVFLFALGGAMLVLALPRFLSAQSREELFIVALDFAVAWAILFLVGALIIVIRKWFEARASSAEKTADRELERIRAEAAVRDSAPPSA